MPKATINVAPEQVEELYDRLGHLVQYHRTIGGTTVLRLEQYANGVINGSRRRLDREGGDYPGSTFSIPAPPLAPKTTKMIICAHDDHVAKTNEVYVTESQINENIARLERARQTLNPCG